MVLCGTGVGHRTDTRDMDIVGERVEEVQSRVTGEEINFKVENRIHATECGH